jgi:hypothetical protein
MLHLHECADLAPIKPIHSIGDSAAVEESAVEPLHSAADPAATESAAEPLQSAADAPTETSCS